VAELRRMAEGNALLLGYRGQGTSYGFCGHTALHWAAAKGHVEAVRWLLRCGADVDARNFAGSTPLHTAVGNEQVRGASLPCTQVARTSRWPTAASAALQAA
jgi:hypothetical protein